ncbi:MAG: bifunctional 4-hydroxy-2-oxoglutarate aldolase/2-dehydro-3-deoxy-phosphogluconate aldolase [Pseudomonadota bacterium]
MTFDELAPLLQAGPVVPVLTINDAGQAGALAEALFEGGVTVAETTLRTADGLAAIKEMKRAAPKLAVGAGTVLSGDDLKRAEDAGSDFIVTPGTPPDLIDALGRSSVSVIPGVATPAEAIACRAAGFMRQKLFPAEIVGGAAMIKALGGPMSDLSFMPTGGVNLDNLKSYLSLPNVFAAGGTWIAREADVDAGDWAGIKARSAEAVAAARS